MADAVDVISLGIVMMLNKLSPAEAETVLRTATSTYFLGASDTKEKGILRLTEFASTMHQYGLKQAHGDAPIDCLEGAREQLKEFRQRG